jgi:hypothetical protein
MSVEVVEAAIGFVAAVPAADVWAVDLLVALSSAVAVVPGLSVARGSRGVRSGTLTRGRLWVRRAGLGGASIDLGRREDGLVRFKLKLGISVLNGGNGSGRVVLIHGKERVHDERMLSEWLYCSV